MRCLMAGRPHCLPQALCAWAGRVSKVQADRAKLEALFKGNGDLRQG
jgi:hypothetical protein